MCVYVCVCVCVCVSVCVSGPNTLPNHAYYIDETFAGDSMGLEEGRRLDFIKKPQITE